MIGGRRQRGTRQGNLVSGLLEPGTSGSVIWTKLHDGTRQVDSQPHAIPPFTSSDLYYHSWVKAKCQHSILHHNRRGTNAIDADTTGSYLPTYLPTDLPRYVPTTVSLLYCAQDCAQGILPSAGTSTIHYRMISSPLSCRPFLDCGCLLLLTSLDRAPADKDRTLLAGLLSGEVAIIVHHY